MAGPTDALASPWGSETRIRSRGEAVVLPAAVRALGGGADDDLLRRLRSWSVGHPGKDPGSFLKEVGVPVEFWNRIGD
jgi:hypothetical protein